MTFSKLMNALNERAVRLRRDGGDLIILGEEETLTPSLLSELSVHKAELLNLVDRNNGDWLSPGFIITPEMLPLVELTQPEIEAIVAGVPGGAPNVQDIYPLTALQEGILFHHLMSARGDVYLLRSLLAFDTRERLEGVIGALREVITRHDTLRTAVVWEGLPEPVQVVWREAPLPVEEVALDPSEGDAADQLRARFDPRRIRLDVRQAPMMRCVAAHDTANGRWLLLWLSHHLTTDHTTLEIMIREAQASLLGEIDRLPEPLPFRNFVAQARLGSERAEQETFFREMLASVEEPTAPYGLLEAQGDGLGIEETRMELEAILGRRLRERARALGVSAASLCHLAWGRVLGRVTGGEDVVFGTVLFGRMGGGEGADRALGLFINTLPIRLHVGKESVERSVRRTQALLGELMRHEHASLALAQRCSGVAAPTPLFSSLLNYRHSPRQAGPSSEASHAWAGIEALDSGGRTNYPLTLSVDDLGDGFALTAQAIRPIEPGRICDYMRTALEGLVEALERAPETEVRAIEALPEAERRQLLEEWNETEADYPREKCVHELFEEQVEKSPEAVALVSECQHLTYNELNRRANRLGYYLRGLGVGPEVLVGIYVERSPEIVIGLLGILKAGGAYVPLDPAYPAERLRFMLDDGEPLVVLTKERLLGELPEFVGKKVCLDRDWPLMMGQNEENPPRQVMSENMAYVIYTSGSTGQPKGVTGLHGGAINRFEWMWRTYPFTTEEVACQKTSLSFVDSVWEIFGPLLQGIRMVIIEDEVAKDGNRLARMLEAEQVSRIVLVPSLLRVLLDSIDDLPGGLRRLKYCISSGEALSPELSEAFSRRLPESGLLNLYGSSEVSADASWHDVGSSEVKSCVSIGRPIANTQIYLLDTQFQPVPVGVQGELYIGGIGVARGYLNLSEQTAERFVPDLYNPNAGTRLYRTGDLGRYLQNGGIEYLGRIDHQVKIRGFRIELGEIEARMAEHVEVREAVVVASKEGEAGKRLVAYYTGREIGAEALRAHLSSALPEYMIPAAYVYLESLPLTPNGKLDRGALPVPDSTAYVAHKYEAPVGEIERTLAQIWADLLKVERVGRRDNFFELGGHSLLGVQTISRLRQSLAVNIPLAGLFTHPVLADFARTIEGSAQAELPPITRVDRNGQLEPSFAQQRLWFLAQFEGASQAYHMPGSLRLSGDLDRQALRRALNQIVARHEAIRTTFSQVDGRPTQVIGPAENGFQLEEDDLRQAEDAAGELRRMAEREARQPFDLERGPLIRGRLVRMAEDEHALLVTMHHIVSDGWSRGILVNELSALYQAYHSGEAAQLPELPIQYADYAAWQQQWLSGGVLERQAEYWKRRLAGAPALLKLPADRRRPAEQDYAGDSIGIELEEGLTGEIKGLSRRHGMTLYMTLLAGWAALLGRLSGQDEVMVGTPMANRVRREIEGLIGFFVNTLALRIDLSGWPRVGELLERVKARTLEAQQNQDIPFEQVVEIVQPVRSLSHAPIFQVMFTWQNAPEGKLDLPGLRITPMEVPRVTARFDLSLSLQETGQRIVGRLEYATALYDRETVERWLGYWYRLLDGMAADEAQWIDRLPMQKEEERRQLLEAWNETEAEYPRDQCVHELFEEQVERTPEAVALSYEDEQMSYGQLNARANQLAHHLRELGVGPDVRVAICLERSMEMVVALLGVLKAGGAYVPLDPEYPLERLAYMLEDAEVRVVVTKQELDDRLPAHCVQMVCGCGVGEDQ